MNKNTPQSKYDDLVKKLKEFVNTEDHPIYTDIVRRALYVDSSGHLSKASYQIISSLLIGMAQAKRIPENDRDKMSKLLCDLYNDKRYKNDFKIGCINAENKTKDGTPVSMVFKEMDIQPTSKVGRIICTMISPDAAPVQGWHSAKLTAEGIVNKLRDYNSKPKNYHQEVQDVLQFHRNRELNIDSKPASAQELITLLLQKFAASDHQPGPNSDMVKLLIELHKHNKEDFKVAVLNLAENSSTKRICDVLAEKKGTATPKLANLISDLIKEVDSKPGPVIK